MNYELSNLSELDESICNAIGMTNDFEYKSNCCGANGKYSNMINENLLNGLTENTSLLNANGEQFSYATAKKDLANLSGCKKPLPPILGILTGGISNINYKKKKKAYEDCLKNYKATLEAQKNDANLSKQQAADASAKLEEAKKELDAVKAEASDSKRTADTTSNDKILGMPKGVAIGLGVAVLAIGGFIIYKKFKK